MTARTLGLAVCLAAVTSSGTEAAPPIDAAYEQLIAVEREFAADAQVLGVTKAFQKYIAPNGVLFRPDPVLGSAALADQQDAVGVTLDWWPAFAGLAQSADLGFNFGPFQVLPANRHGFFLTVWGKQPNGEWKYLIDRGPRPAGVPIFKKDGPVGRLPVYSGGPIPDGTKALEIVRALENAMTVELQSDVKATFLKHLADDAWVVGSTSQPEQGRTFFLGELDRRPRAAFQQPVGGGQSKAGDLVYTYGLMTWADEKDATVPGHYLRVWQRRGDTWKIVADEFVPPAAPPRSPPARPSIPTATSGTSTPIIAQQRSGAPDLTSIADAKAWKISDATAEALEVDGRRAVRLTVGGDWVGLALPVGWNFRTGTIDVDLKGKNLKQRSFLGIAFNVVDEKTFEAVYFRPFNFKAEEPFRKRSVQYIALPENTWQKLRENTPGQFENSVNPVPDPDRWFHARIEVTDSQVRVFVNGATEASLEVARLALGGESRAAGLFVSTVEGIYANLRITPTIK